ncbi:MAG: GNAT family N-acetyltransferase [Thermoproteota archaeon]|nr:GNAT family N-acetyltransferase [Thermoproteota archaeon]
MEFNEFYFCSLWTEHFRIRNCADILLNEKLTEDYFFNRLTNITCIEIDTAIDEGVRISLKKGIDCYVYVPDDNKKLEDMLLGKGFTLVDSMSVLRCTTNSIEYDNNNIDITKIDIDSIPIWVDVFCDAFDIQNWKNEVQRIIQSHFKELILLVSYLKNKSNVPVGCTALFHRCSLIGLYCLGTVSGFRGQGIATKMVKVALEIAQQSGLDFIFLQAFANEGIIGFYNKLGFQTIYKKKVYAFLR